MSIHRIRKLAVATGLLICQSVFAQLVELRLPTAEDGEVIYQLNSVTKKPLSAQDDRSEVMAVSLVFLPKKPGEELRWGFLYQVRFKDGAIPKSIVVYSENNKPTTIEVRDASPTLKENTWSAISKPNVMDEKAFQFMTEKDPWFLQRKFVISYADGAERTLHQLAIITNPMRFQLLETIFGRPISQPAAAPKFDSRQWKVGYKNGNESQRITEFVLQDQTVDAWRELFTKQEFIGRNIALDKLLSQIRSGFGSDCQSLNWDVLSANEAEAIYQWSHDGCKNYPPQFEISRLIRTDQGICRWAYTSKEVPVTQSSRKLFKSIIEKLKCD